MTPRANQDRGSGTAQPGSPAAGSRGHGPISTLVCSNCGATNRIGPSERGAPHCGKCGKPLAWVVSAGEATFDVEARAQPTVVVDLWAPWCGPCRMVSPALAQVATDMAGRLKLVKVNVDDSPRLQQRFGVQSIPTLLVMREGKVTSRQVGAAPAAALRSWVEQALAA
jgi:thioredoxin 2